MIALRIAAAYALGYASTCAVDLAFGDAIAWTANAAYALAAPAGYLTAAGFDALRTGSRASRPPAKRPGAGTR